MSAAFDNFGRDFEKNLKALGLKAFERSSQGRAKQDATRFAPSPTGHLHLGHVASALCVNGLGRALGFSPLLRIEDHDRGRSRADFEAAIVADLSWLGIPYENLAAARATPSAFRQSDNPARYERALEHLAAEGRLYGCDCTRKRLAALTPAVDPEADGQQELVYDGFCRARGLDWRQPGVGARFRVPAGDVAFFDGFLGPVTQAPAAQCGDVLLRDRHGNFTYQLAVTVDDDEQGIGLVTRGQDLLASTGRQLLLAQALGRPAPPLFAHHPLLVDEAGKKLGKRFFSASISERRARGDDPRMLIGEALRGLRLIGRAQPVTVAESEALFVELAPIPAGGGDHG